jgi:hypothetical protein
MARSFKIITDLRAPVLRRPLRYYRRHCLQESNEQEVGHNDTFAYLVPLLVYGQRLDPRGQNHDLQLN